MTFQTFIVLSCDPLTILLPSNWTQLMPPVCPCKTHKLIILPQSHPAHLKRPDMTLSSHPSPPELEPLHKDLSPVRAAPSPPLQLGHTALLTQPPWWPLTQGLPQGGGQAVVSPGGADLPCCGQVHWGEQSQDLISDVEGEEGEGVRAARGAEVMQAWVVIW